MTSTPSPRDEAVRAPAAGAPVAALVLERTLPMPVARRVRRNPAPSVQGCPDAGPRPGSAPVLREEARLVAAVVGTMAINFVPAAWVVVGRPSIDLLMFALLVALSWTLDTLLQIAVLRWRRARGDSPAMQFAVVAVAGAAFSLVFSSPLNPYGERLGLNAVDAWGSGVYAAWTSVLVAAFLVWHREGRHRHAEAAQRLRSVQLAQLAARRALVESQLQAMQARIDPQHFFDILDAIERLYRHDTARAEALFDELVVFLRAALPSLQQASSLLARELDLASACVRMHALASGEEVGVEIDVDRSLQRSAFPPGLLLPLLRGMLCAGAGRCGIGLSAHLEPNGGSAAALVLSITAIAPPDETTLRCARETLRSLFGAGATIACDPPCDQRVSTRLRIDHENL